MDFCAIRDCFWRNKKQKFCFARLDTLFLGPSNGILRNSQTRLETGHWSWLSHFLLHLCCICPGYILFSSSYIFSVCNGFGFWASFYRFMQFSALCSEFYITRSTDGRTEQGCRISNAVVESPSCMICLFRSCVIRWNRWNPLQLKWKFTPAAVSRG